MEKRDLEVVNFINMVGLCESSHVKELYFPDVHKNICMRRLKKLAEDGHINRVKMEGNVFVYYNENKPSKRILFHDLQVTNFVVKMIKEGYEILEFKRTLVIGTKPKNSAVVSNGSIIPDAYIKYKYKDGVVRHLVLEIQLSGTVENCISKYKNFKNLILESNLGWNTIPRIVCITNMKDRIELRGLKVLYDNTDMNNINEILRG